MQGRDAATGKRAVNLERCGEMLVTKSSRLTPEVLENSRRPQQENERGLQIACSLLDRLLLLPGDVFSLWSVVGDTGRRRGCGEGFEIRDGVPAGGLCLLADTILWMAIRLDLEIIEHHRHDPNLPPDDGGTVPSGVGATVLPDCLDLRFRNTLQQPLVMRVALDPALLRCSIYSDRPLSFAVEIFVKEQRCFRDPSGVVWRATRVAKRVHFLDGRAPVEVEIGQNLRPVLRPVQQGKIDQPPAAPERESQHAAA